MRIWVLVIGGLVESGCRVKGWSCGFVFCVGYRFWRGCYDEYVEYGKCGVWGVLVNVGFCKVVVVIVWLSCFYGYCCYGVFCCCVKCFYELVFVVVSVYVFLGNGGFS